MCCIRLSIWDGARLIEFSSSVSTNVNLKQEYADDTFGLPLMVAARRVVLASTQNECMEIVPKPLSSFPLGLIVNSLTIDYRMSC